MSRLFSAIVLFLYLCTVESLTGWTQTVATVFFLRHLNDRPSEVDLPMVLGVGVRSGHEVNIPIQKERTNKQKNGKVS